MQRVLATFAKLFTQLNDNSANPKYPLDIEVMPPSLFNIVVYLM